MKQLFARNIDYILLAAIFLPYIPNGNGLRVEHLIVYGIFLFLLVAGWIQRFRIQSYSTVLLMYGLIFFHVVLSTVIHQVPTDLKFLANFENYLETFVLFLIFNALLRRKKYFTRRRMLKINRIFHILLAINTILILFEIFTPYADAIIHYYVQGGGENFREDTNSMGRYTGVFDIVFAGGFAYSLGLITWVYNFSIQGRNKLLLQVILLLFILIGGFASVSKVFFLGGILISSYLFLRIGRIKPKVAITVLGSMAIALIAPYFIEDWKGFGLFEEYWTRFVRGSAIETISSGRLGSEHGVYSMALRSDVSLFFGKGLTMGNLPYFDSEHVQIYFQGGIVAILAYILMYLKKLQLCIGLGPRFEAERLFLLAILIMGIFTAFGGPVLFMNRVRIFFFLQLFFLYRLSLVTDQKTLKSRKNARIFNPYVSVQNTKR